MAELKKTLLRGGRVIDPANGIDEVMDVLVEGTAIAAVGKDLACEGAEIIDCEGKVVAPGFIDLHCHLRDPGQEYKEDIVSGTRAAAHGGFTTVCCMPNTSPVNDSAAVTRYIIEKAETMGSGVRVLPVGAVTKGTEGTEMAEVGRMKAAGIVAISDDGRPVKNSGLLRLAMQYAAHFGVFVMSHSEDKSLVGDGVMNEGYMSTKLGLPGTTRAAEEVCVARDIILAETEHLHLHLCHLSTRGCVQMVREAKARGVNITCETTPHYIGATENWVEGYDSMCRVNPPLREEADRLACIEGLRDGTIDCISTDHAPHHMDEKNVEFALAASGISGFETAFAVCNTELVKRGPLTLPQLIERMTVRPAKILKMDLGTLTPGRPADITVLDPDRLITVDPAAFLSKGKNTPFAGRVYSGEVEMTIARGRVAYKA